MTDTYTNEIDAAEQAEADRARAGLIASIRAYADLLEQHPDLPHPYSMHTTVYTTEAECRAARKGIPGWRKVNTPDAGWIEYHHHIGGEHTYDRSSFTVTMEVSKENTCKRVQTGVEHIEARTIEAHDVKTYEWRCGPQADDDATE